MPHCRHLEILKNHYKEPHVFILHYALYLLWPILPHTQPGGWGVTVPTARVPSARGCRATEPVCARGRQGHAHPEEGLPRGPGASGLVDPRIPS